MSADLPAATAPSGAEAALAEFHRATARVAAALTSTTIEDDVVAFGCVVLLDQALGQLAGMLRVVPSIIKLAAAGDTATDRIARYQAELLGRQSEVAAIRARLDAMHDLEQDVTETEAERNQLRDRIEAIEHAQRMAAELPSLRAHLATLEAAVADPDAGDAAEIGARLAAAAGELRAITQRQREVLGEHTSKLIADAELASSVLSEEQARNDAAAADLAARTKQAEQMTAELRKNLEVLAAWRQADAELADGLSAAGLAEGESALQRARAELAAVEKRISDLDGQLRPLLAEHARAYKEAREARPL
jgi:DNA repair exonuclease SbcCD ATPase subunit